MNSAGVTRQAIRRGSVLISVLVPVLVGVLVSASPAAGSVDSGSSAVWGSRFLAGESTDGIYRNLGQPDWGLTSDVVFAFAGTGSEPQAAARSVAALEANAASYLSPFGEGETLAGPLAKLTLVAVTAGGRARNFAGRDLRAELVATMNRDPSSPNLGRFEAIGEADDSNAFTQAIAVTALARSGGVPVEAVEFLLNQQCPNGGVRLYFGAAGGRCTDAARSDVDATALAAQAMVAARDAAEAGTESPALTAALDAALDWLILVQRSDGSFGGGTAGGGSGGSSNTNSTGLAAQALATAGDEGAVTAVQAARAFLLGAQLDCSAAVAEADRGAIAYDPVARETAAAAGAIGSRTRDQFRRSTAQAVLGLSGASLGSLDLGAPAVGTAPPPCSGSATTTTTTTSSSTTTSTSTTSTTTTVVSGAVLGTSSTRAGTRSASTGSASTGSASTGSLAVTGSSSERRMVLAATLLVGGGLLVASGRVGRRSVKPGRGR